MPCALVFFPHNPFPPRSGAHRRCLEMISGFRALGYQVTLASSQFTTESHWEDLDSAALAAAGDLSLQIHWMTRWDWRYWNYASAFYRLTRLRPALSSLYQVSLTLPFWFTRLYETLEPEVVLMNYALYDRVVTGEIHRGTLTVIDTLDLVTQYLPRFDALSKGLPPPPISPAQVDPAVLEPEYLDRFNGQVSPGEYRIYDKYDRTIAITSVDAEMVSRHAPYTRVHVLPMTHDIPQIINTYDGPAIFPTGPNPFNVQGYLYFVTRVLPRVLKQAPDFCLTVTGKVCDVVTPSEGVELYGYAPNLAPLYAQSRFLVCPILSKTGQLVKIIEAMAHGVPVVASSRAAEGSPLRHGENGLIARDADEFADQTVRLWQDQRLCRKLGEAGRATIAADYSTRRLIEGLGAVLA